MGLGSLIGGIGGGIGGFALGGPAGAFAGYQAGSYLGGAAQGALGSGGGHSSYNGLSNPQDAARAQQQQYLAALKAAADGSGPSAAQAQMRMGTDRLQAMQQSLAASSPGMSPAAANRMAAVQSAGIGQGMTGQMALLRAQEQAQARQQYAAALEAMRQQDLAARGQDLNYKQGKRGQDMQIAGAGLSGLASLGGAYISSGGLGGGGSFGGTPTGGGGDSLMTPAWA